jgi:hypothetical protein
MLQNLKLDSPEVVAFIDFLRSEGIDCIFPFDDKYWVGLKQFMYTTAIVRGAWYDEYGYEDRWCFKHGEHAFVALVTWAAEEFKDEPQGWHRHPISGRRRPEGNAELEYINP